MMDKPYIDDWAGPMLWVEKNIRDINDGLLHKNYDGINEKMDNVVHALNVVAEWIETHREQ